MDATAAQIEAGAAAPHRSAVLSLSRVSKRWAGAPSPVLSEIELNVEPGVAAAITGRNGAGKTTLLRIAAGLILPDTGDVEVTGLHLERDRKECQRRLGFLAAGNSGLYGRLKVEQHLDFWSRLSMVPRKDRARSIHDSLDRFELHELCGRRVDRLSMGQRQRLRISLAFLHEPQLVLLDEPRTSLDDEGAALLDRAVERLTSQGGAALICAPTGEQAGVRLDRCYAVHDGSLIAA